MEEYHLYALLFHDSFTYLNMFFIPLYTMTLTILLTSYFKIDIFVLAFESSFQIPNNIQF